MPGTLMTLLNRPEPLLRIGKSIRAIPEDYKSLFANSFPSFFNEEIYSPNLKLILHLNEGILPTNRILLVEGRREANNFMERFRFLLKWGHFVWRLSDLSALRLEPVRIIKPAEEENTLSCCEMKVHWQFKVEATESLFYIDGEKVKLNFRNLLKVQYHRLIPKTNTNSTTRPVPKIVLYSGISRYVFDKSTGFCKEVHVERIEPRISGVEWKWRIAKGREISSEVI